MKTEDLQKLDEIIERTRKGEDMLEMGATDIAFDQFIDIRKLAEQLKETVG